MEGRVKCTHPGCLRHFKKLKGMQNHLATHANLRNILCRYNCGAGFNVYGPRNLHEKLYCKKRPMIEDTSKGVKRKASEDGPEAKQPRTDSPAAASSPSCASPALPIPSCASPYPPASARFGSFSPLAQPQATQQSHFISSPVQLQGQFYSPPQQYQYYSTPMQQYNSSPQQYQYYSTPQQYQYYSTPQQHQYYSPPQQQQSFVSAYHPQSNFYQPQSSYGQFASSGSGQLTEPPGLSYATLQPVASVSNPLPSDLCSSPPSTCSNSLNDGSVAQQQPQLAAASDEPSLEKILLDVLASDSHDESTDSWLYKPNHL